MINYSAVEYLQANNMLALASSLTQTASSHLAPSSCTHLPFL